MKFARSWWCLGIVVVLGASTRAQSTVRVSEVPASIAVGNGWSGQSAISADGRYVAFSSFASNLVLGDVNDETDVFLRDRQTGTTTLVSVATTGEQGLGQSLARSVSADGRIVVFESYAYNLVPGDSFGSSDIFVRDLQSGVTSRVSVDPGGDQPTRSSSNAPSSPSSACVRGSSACRSR